MRLGPVFLVLLVYLWLLLGAAAWAVGAVARRSAPRLVLLPLALAAGFVGTLALAVGGLRGGLGLLLSLLIVPALALLAGLLLHA